jgi:hypothetical protein
MLDPWIVNNFHLSEGAGVFNVNGCFLQNDDLYKYINDIDNVRPGVWSSAFMSFIKRGVLEKRVLASSALVWFKCNFGGHYPDWLMTACIDAGSWEDWNGLKRDLGAAELCTKVIYANSGAGKSTFSSAEYIDIDRLHDEHGDRAGLTAAVAKAKETGDWSTVNQFHWDIVQRCYHLIAGKTLLAHGPDLIPRNLFDFEAYHTFMPVETDSRHDPSIVKSNYEYLKEAAATAKAEPTTGYLNEVRAFNWVSITDRLRYGRFVYNSKVHTRRMVDFESFDKLELDRLFPGVLTFEQRQDKWVVVAIDGATKYIRSAARLFWGKRISERLFAKILDDCYSNTETPLVQRQRMSPRALVRVMVADREHEESSMVEEYLACMIGLGWQALAGFYLMIHLNREAGAYILNLMVRIGRYGFERNEAILKLVHGLARRGRRVVPVGGVDSPQPSWVMYLNTVLGRFYFPEVANDSTVADRVLYQGQHIAFDVAKGAFTAEEHKRVFDLFHKEQAGVAARVWMKSKLLTMDQYMQSYLATGASGSAGGRSGARFDITTSVSKRLYMADLTTDEAVEMLVGAEPGAYTATIVKREAGKSRQLCASPFYHFQGEQMVCYETEPAILQGLKNVAVGKDAATELKHFVWRVNQMMEGKHVACLDWADFNITHNFDDFAAYFVALGEAAKASCNSPNWYKGVSKGDFIYGAAMWCAEALYNMNLRNSADPDSVSTLLNRGLWSGWRTTQFFNTSYNVAYSREANAFVMGMIGEAIDSLHAGDDVIGFGESELAAMYLAAGMTFGKHVLQASKQLLCGPTSEFLRVEFFRDGTALGSLARCISGFVGSDLQAPIIRSGLEQGSGTNEALHQLVRRGGDSNYVRRIRYPLVSFWSTIDSPTGTACPSIALMQLDPRCGGLGWTQFGEGYNTLPVRLSAWPTLGKYARDARMPVQAAGLVQSVHRFVNHYGYTVSNNQLLEDLVLHSTYGNDWPTDTKRVFDLELMSEQVEHIEKCNSIVAAYNHLEYSRHTNHLWVREQCRDVIELIKQRQGDLVECSDVNGIADAIRSLAIGVGKGGEGVLNLLKDNIGRVVDSHAIRTMGGNASQSLYDVLSRYLMPNVVVDLIGHRVNIPTGTHGVVPPQLRAYVYHLVCRLLRTIKTYYPDTASDSEELAAYVRRALDTFTGYYIAEIHNKGIYQV